MRNETMISFTVNNNNKGTVTHLYMKLDKAEEMAPSIYVCGGQTESHRTYPLLNTFK